MLNFKQHLWLAKRTTNWHVGAIVGHFPTLPRSGVRHLPPPHFYNLIRSSTERIGAINIIHGAADS